MKATAFDAFFDTVSNSLRFHLFTLLETARHFQNDTFFRKNSTFETAFECVRFHKRFWSCLSSGGSRGGARGRPLFWVKKEEMTEGKMADRASKSRPAFGPPPPPLVQGLDPPLLSVDDKQKRFKKYTFSISVFNENELVWSGPKFMYAVRDIGHKLN